MGGKLSTGAAVGATGALAFLGGFLRGYTWGAEDALNGVRTLRHFAECRGEWGCEWVFHEGHKLAGEPVASRKSDLRYFRYFVPFGRLPLVRATPLGRLKYDLAKPLSRGRPAAPPVPDGPERDGK